LPTAAYLPKVKAVSDSLTHTDALIAAITIEGAIFVAFSLAFALTQPNIEKGRHPFFARAWFGWVVVGVMAVVAASAWADLSLLYRHTPTQGTAEWLQRWGLAIGIAAQPIIAAVINAVSR
jgi:uncharacterized membrane protein YbhN (UPF0104 family)